MKFGCPSAKGNQPGDRVSRIKGEDRIHTRSDHCAENLALLRRLALNILQHDPRKLSIRAKIKRAGRDEDCLAALIAQMR